MSSSRILAVEALFVVALVGLTVWGFVRDDPAVQGIADEQAIAEQRRVQDEAVSWLQEYVQVDTVNPEGNEYRAVDFLAKIFVAEGIDYETVESAPGRGNIWARLEGGDEPALILLHHSDVVPADPKHWTTDPLSGEIRDGYLLGRGTMDMKDTGIAHLSAFLELHRRGVKLKRDVIFMATADEEAGGYLGAGWLVENRPELFDGVGFLLNEGGFGLSQDGNITFSVEVTQKVPVWLRLTAVDVPGHGSMPRATSSVTRIVNALKRFDDNPFPARILPEVDVMFKAMSENATSDIAPAFAEMSTAVEQPEFLDTLREISPMLHSLTRDTCAMTRMGASNKINVIPPEAWAELDCRILPDRLSQKFVADVKTLLEGTGVDVEVLMAFAPGISPIDTELFSTIRSVMMAKYPNAIVTPSVSTGFTDSHFFRDIGITSYGFMPAIFEMKDVGGVHGNDERINVDAFRTSVTDTIDIVTAFVGADE